MCATCGCAGDGHQLKAFLPGARPRSFAGLKLSNSDHSPANSELRTANSELRTANSELRTANSELRTANSKLVVDIERDILDKNNRLAERNRGYFEAKNIVALNMVSSPGSGKTSILERTLADKGREMAFFIVEGDQQTSRDAERIAAGGAPVVQVNTGKGCHLEAEMVHQAIRQLQPTENSVVVIENVGNLVCPSMFDLGESKRVVVISITEGEDKPLKYPDMFHTSQLCIINKIDLLPYLKFDVEALKTFALQVNPGLEFIELSATSGEGMNQWYAWIKKQQTASHFSK